MAKTAKERAWDAIRSMPMGMEQVDIREYVQYLEQQLAQIRVERNNLRDPRGGNY